MWLFDFLKKKPPANKLSLESLLQKAAKEPAYRNEFYDRLLTDDLTVITEARLLPVGHHVLQTDQTVNLLTLPDGRIPVFTSPERIFDKGVIKQELPILTMNGKDLFTMAKGAIFILNPYSDFGKDLLPEEIESMLNGSINNGHRKIEIKKDTQVMIGQPAVYPTEMVTVIKTIFARDVNVEAAFLGWIINPSSGEPPHYIFGVKGQGDLQNIITEAGNTAQQFLKPTEIVDFIKVDKNNGVSDYFIKNCEPFYKR